LDAVLNLTSKMTIPFSFVVAALTAASCSAAGAAYAQAPVRSEPRASLAECRRLQDDGARLACFDRLAEKGESSEAPPSEGRRAAVPAAKISDAPASSSAASAGASSRSGRADDSPYESPAPGTTVTIVEIRRPTIGHPRFIAADGTVFAQTSMLRGRFPPVPFEAQLEAGANHSLFLVSPSGGPDVRVSRSD
jgi:hypothetical protein